MSDITKIREWLDTDEPEPGHGWDWPAPPICIESAVSGDLRASILAKLGRSASDPAEVRIIEMEVEGGWSEFTVETDYQIEVWLHAPGQSQRLIEFDCQWSREDALARFLRWVSA